MLCQSHKGTLNVIDGIVKGYDDLPRSWRSDLIDRIQPEQTQVPLQCNIFRHCTTFFLHRFWMIITCSVLGFLSHQVVKVTLLSFHLHAVLSV